MVRARLDFHFYLATKHYGVHGVNRAPLPGAALAQALERGYAGSGCPTRTLSGPARRDAALRRWSARRLAGANALQANQRPKAR